MIQFVIIYTIYSKLINFRTKINILRDVKYNIYVYFRIFKKTKDYKSIRARKLTKDINIK